MSEQSQVALINAEINRELANADVGRALLATTFKGLNPVSMKQAILEGMIRGFKFKDFLEKNVYAIPFGNAYSLITSIDYARKIGGRSGVVGKSAPEYGEEEGMGLWCSVTIKKRSGGYIGDYTSKVYMKEFSTGRNLWSTKPRVMLAKVAEAHALRMACPEQLSQMYVEEEMEKEKEVVALHESYKQGIAEQHEPMPSYTVERIVPAADDDEQSEPIASARVAAEEKPKVSAKKKTKVEEHDDAIENMFEEDK